LKDVFYGRLAPAIGPQWEGDAPPGSSVAQLRERLVAEYPEAEEPMRSRRARACVGDSIVHDDYVLRPEDRIEFLPPVSGG
jgi:molybdopterin converting factor small subunit